MNDQTAAVARRRPFVVSPRPRARTPLLAALEDVRPHDHLCLLYTTPAEEFAAVVPYLRLGLERGERCVYIVDENTAEDVLRALQDDGVDAAAAVASGALLVISKRESYLQKGYFDPDAMIRFLEEAVTRAESDGFAALRATAEMTWALGPEGGVERLIEYEAKLNGLFPRREISAICQYNRTRFGPDVIREVIHTHPYVVNGGSVARNPFFIPLQEYLTPAHSAVEVERLLENIGAFQKSQDDLRRQAEEVRDLYERAPCGYHSLDADGVFVRVNETELRWLGYAREEVLGRRKFLDLVTPPSRKLFEDRFPAYKELGEIRDLEFDMVRKDGSTLPVLLNATAVRDASGRFVMSRSVVVDITRRVAAEEASRRSEASLNRAQAVAHVGSWSLDLPRDELLWSDEAYRIFGIPAGTPMTYEKFMDKVHPEDREAVKAAWAGALERGPYDIEHRVLLDGRVKWVRERAEVEFGSDGRALRGVGTVQDVTELKRAEDEIRTLNAELEERVRARTAELETANKDLEAFAFSVSHDLRAPLRTMDGFSQILLERYAPKLEPECRRYLGLVRKGAATMGRLIDDLLKFSRLGRQAVARSSLSMERVVRAAAASLADQIEGRRVSLRVGALPPCEGDPALLHQVWVNLLSNALKFTRERPEAVIEIDSREEAGETVYRVKDNGVGFDMRHVDRIFGVFQRLHPKEQYEGTGVGLAIVARIIERHGGRVWARGEPGRGAEFFFTLGATRGTPAA